MDKYTTIELFHMMYETEALVDNHAHGVYDDFIKHQNAILEIIKAELRARGAYA